MFCTSRNRTNIRCQNEKTFIHLTNIICTYFLILIFFNQIFGCENKLSDWREPKTKIIVSHNLFLKSKKIIIFKFNKLEKMENRHSILSWNLEGLNSIFIKKKKKKVGLYPCGEELYTIPWYLFFSHAPNRQV